MIRLALLLAGLWAYLRARKAIREAVELLELLDEPYAKQPNRVQLCPAECEMRAAVTD